MLVQQDLDKVLNPLPSSPSSCLYVSLCVPGSHYLVMTGWYLICSSGWPQTYNNTLVSASQMPGLQMYMTTPSSCFVLFYYELNISLMLVRGTLPLSYILSLPIHFFVVGFLCFRCCCFPLFIWDSFTEFPRLALKLQSLGLGCSSVVTVFVEYALEPWVQSPALHKGDGTRLWSWYFRGACRSGSSSRPPFTIKQIRSQSWLQETLPSWPLPSTGNTIAVL